jgi:hypothetical protein
MAALSIPADYGVDVAAIIIPAHPMSQVLLCWLDQPVVSRRISALFYLSRAVQHASLGGGCHVALDVTHH